MHLIARRYPTLGRLKIRIIFLTLKMEESSFVSSEKGKISSFKDKNESLSRVRHA